MHIKEQSEVLFVQFHRERNFFFHISPILAEQKHGNIGRIKSLLGTWRGFISSTSREIARFRLQITAIKVLGCVKYKILERETKVTQRSNYAVPCQAFRTVNE